LSETFSDEVISKLCLHVKAKKIAPEEIIFDRNELASKLYFVLNGKINTASIFFKIVLKKN